MLIWQETILRLFIAAVLGGLVGIERQRYDWAAGLRTHMLVCLGSSLMMIISSYGFADVLGNEHVALDPSRVAAQVVSGIGFLGAGTIFFLKRGEVIKGLTTAAGLWTVAGIGLAIGSGLYIAAIATTVLTLIILAVVKPYKKKFSRTIKQHEIQLFVERNKGNLQEIEDLCNNYKLNIENILFEKTDDPNKEHIILKFENYDKSTSILQLTDAFLKIEGIIKASLNF